MLTAYAPAIDVAVEALGVVSDGTTFFLISGDDDQG